MFITTILHGLSKAIRVNSGINNNFIAVGPSLFTTTFISKVKKEGSVLDIEHIASSTDSIVIRLNDDYVSGTIIANFLLT